MSTDTKPYTEDEVRSTVVAGRGACKRSGMYCYTHDAYWPSGQYDCNDFVDLMEDAERTLDAVAPRIIARAKAEALREEADRTYTHTMIRQDNGRTTQERPVWPVGVALTLRKRADDIEAGR